MPRKSDVFSPVTEPQFRIVLQRLVPCLDLKSCQWCQSRFAPPNQSEDKQESTTWEMLVSEFHVFFCELFEKNNGFPHEFFAPFFWVNLPSKLKPNKKLPVCQAVDHCESCNPGYYVSGTSCKAFFFLVGWSPEVWHFHPWKVTENPKRKESSVPMCSIFVEMLPGIFAPKNETNISKNMSLNGGSKKKAQRFGTAKKLGKHISLRFQLGLTT